MRDGRGLGAVGLGANGEEELAAATDELDTDPAGTDEEEDDELLADEEET